MRGTKAKALRRLAAERFINTLALKRFVYVSKASGASHEKLAYPPGSFMRFYKDLKRDA